MTDHEVRIADQTVAADAGTRLEWVDREAGTARLVDASGSRLVAVEGGGTDWVVTLAGRRVSVRVESWRERMLAAAETASASRGGPVDVKATLPGLVVAIAVAVGDEVTEGQPLLTIEAMKMQNEVRAPRAGRVARIAIEAGTAVATGALLVRLEDGAEG